MFDFFEKKIFLVDYLHGLVDIHNHILPGIDDGSKTVQESIELIQKFSELGITNFVFTPHIMHHYYPNTPQTIKSAFNLLHDELKHRGISDININYAAEYMIDDNFEDHLERKSILPLHNDYLLVEMSYLQPSINFETAIRKVQSLKLLPVFAHPERYFYLHNQMYSYAKFKTQGILFQMNMLSLGGYYGKDVQKVAQKLLDDGMYDFIASDVHSLNHILELYKISLNKRRLDKILALVNKTINTFY